jgi:hypothetical protein
MMEKKCAVRDASLLLQLMSILKKDDDISA